MEWLIDDVIKVSREYDYNCVPKRLRAPHFPNTKKKTEVRGACVDIGRRTGVHLSQQFFCDDPSSLCTSGASFVDCDVLLFSSKVQTVH